MLVLTRKADEEIVIGEDKQKIVIKLLKIQGDKVSIGIEADRKTPILRKELTRKGKIQGDLSQA